jgi:hypothetical protein
MHVDAWFVCWTFNAGACWHILCDCKLCGWSELLLTHTVVAKVSPCCCIPLNNHFMYALGQHDLLVWIKLRPFVIFMHSLRVMIHLPVFSLTSNSYKLFGFWDLPKCTCRVPKSKGHAHMLGKPNTRSSRLYTRELGNARLFLHLTLQISMLMHCAYNYTCRLLH